MMRQLYGGLGSDFWDARPLVGMIHLPALPGSPFCDGRDMASILEFARADVRALSDGGATALMIENFFDTPFAKDSVPPHTVAALTRAVAAVREITDLPIGVNVLRNDALAALAIAHVCGAQFVRINVFVGAAVTDQGIIEGAARAAVLYRRELSADVAIWADILVKHAAQLGTTELEDAARDAVYRGHADALILSGAATGLPTSPDDLARARQAVPTVPLLVGSGFDTLNAASLLAHANGAIVGTSLKQNGDVTAPIDPARVRKLRQAMQISAQKV